MSYQSVDKLQLALATKVFHYAKDAKKASGRALGTMIELITFYLLKDWGLEEGIRIEKGLIEYRNASVSHNVEYTLHPTLNSKKLILKSIFPLNSTKIIAALQNGGPFDLTKFKQVSSTLVSTNSVIKNSCLIARNQDSSLIAVVTNQNEQTVDIEVTEQYEKPYAMIECKRVGVEEGMKKGPQTIEKAKQGAYVAKTISSLQKVRNYDGTLFGLLPIGKDNFKFGKYDELLREVITTDNEELYKDFILTIGIVSNHGNWFTSTNPNKELLVLRDAYDWLLFLTDKGLATFIEELLLNPQEIYKPAQTSFLSSYTSGTDGIRKTGKNQFTKAQIGVTADLAIQDYFRNNREKIAKWFNIITPENVSIDELRQEIKILAGKKWK